ncbi:hypothetical protein BCF33_2552 [Hasllibacter halocynthiae]|uniref:Uncharacterized protein n=1 Tax=Hasllibacter halocynthiae TaxID=595589 RepID=A0A2T0X405_9RHOB|nr:hypothetical protein [Hasllibacter halocynthiae]PRY93671.1 hypothetical protein BCF33_2552 [Hasllibacter halocynthiae]
MGDRGIDRTCHLAVDLALSVLWVAGLLPATLAAALAGEWALRILLG